MRLALSVVGARPVRKASSTEPSMCMSQTDSIQIVRPVQDAVSASGDKSFVVQGELPSVVLPLPKCFLEPVEEAFGMGDVWIAAQHCKA